MYGANNPLISRWQTLLRIQIATRMIGLDVYWEIARNGATKDMGRKKEIYM